MDDGLPVAIIIAIVVLAVLLVLVILKMYLNALEYISADDELTHLEDLNEEEDDYVQKRRLLRTYLRLNKRTEHLAAFFKPYNAICKGIASVILFLRGVPKKIDDSVTEDEILSMVNEGHEQGVIETSEAAMISNIFEFGDKEAGDIMTNRNNVIALANDTKLGDALKLMLSESYSRYPVFIEDLNHICGILYLKDAMRFHDKDDKLDDKPISEIKNLLRDSNTILETMNINDLFKMMQSKKSQMAIVVDEYGQTRGLVTMEDILEEIVGNIMDEYDIEEKHIRKKGDGFVIDGLTSLTEIEEKLPVHFEVDDFETLNGYLISKLEHLPEKDEEFETCLGDYSFSILKVENRMINKVLCVKTNKKAEEMN